MTPAALHRLREIAAEQRRLAEEAAHLLAALDGAPIAPATKADRWLNTKEAMRVSRVNSPSTLYRWARMFSIGEKTNSGSWRFSERGLMRVLRKEKSSDGEFGEFGEAAPVSMAKRSAHVLTE